MHQSCGSSVDEHDGIPAHLKICQHASDLRARDPVFEGQALTAVHLFSAYCSRTL